MSWSTKAWLKGFGLEQYYNSFIENGYETQKLCANLKDEDLDGMDITNQSHRRVFLNQADMLRTVVDKPSTSSSVGNESPELSSRNSPRVRDQTDGTKSPNQKHRSNSTSHAEKTSTIIDTSTYTAVFDDVVDTKRIKKKKIRSPKAPPKRTDGKTDPIKPLRKIQQMPESSISELASVPPHTMTKLQLKLRIKEMLARDSITLSHPKYFTQEGNANDVLLSEVAETYAEELGLEGLEVFDAVKHVWRYVSNEKSDYVLPKSNPSTPGTGSSISGASFNEVFEQSNYSEPFDATTSGLSRPKLTPRKISTEIVNSRAIPPVTPTIPTSSNYAEPFDAIPVNNQPVIVKTSPEKKHKTIQPLTTPKHNYKTSNESLAVDKRTSKTLPPSSSPNLSMRSSSSEDSPCLIEKQSPRMKKQWNPFNRSGKADHTLLPQTAVLLPGLEGKKIGSTSAENLTKISDLSLGTKRKSLPPSEFGISPGLPRSISSNPALLYQQCLEEDGNKKNITESQESLDKLQSNLQQIPLEQKANEDTDDFKVTSRVKGLTVANRAASELELSNMLEVYVEGSDQPVKFQRYEEIATTKDEKKKSLLRRLFYKRKSKDEKNKSITEEVTSVSSDSENKNGLTSSTSLPDITAAATIHSEYAEVFDVEPGSTSATPPKLPSRNRPHSAKTARRIMPSPGSSPSATPITHHKLMVKSDSINSNDVIHSTPTSNKDDIIEISMPAYEEAFAGAIGLTDSLEKKHYDNITDTQFCLNKYDDPWKPILRPKPKSRKGRVSSSESRGTSEEPDLSTVKQKPPLAPKPQRLSGEQGSTPSSQSSLSPSHEVFSTPTHIVSPSKTQPPPKPSRSRGISKSPSPEPSTTITTTDHLKTNSTVDTLKSIPDEYPIPLPRRKMHSPEPHDDTRTKQSTSSIDSEIDQPSQTPVSPQKPPKPLRKRIDTGSSSKPESLSGNLLQIALQEKLSKEAIDITSSPYSSKRGEYGIPSALVSRYSEEIGNPEDEIVKMLDKIRRNYLLKARRAHIPLKKDWKKFSDINTCSMTEFLTSIGLPQYCDTLLQEGFVSIAMLKGQKWSSLLIEENHKIKLDAFVEKL